MSRININDLSKQETWTIPVSEELAALRAENERLRSAGDRLAREVNPCLLEMARHSIGNTNVAVIELRIKEWKEARDARTD